MLNKKTILSVMVAILGTGSLLNVMASGKLGAAPQKFATYVRGGFAI